MTARADMKPVLDAVGAVLALGPDDQLHEANTRAIRMTDAQLTRASAALTMLGLAVGAELRRRRRGESAHVD